MKKNGWTYAQAKQAAQGHHAHHILPQGLQKQFTELGLELNIHDPKYGIFLEEGHHLSKAKKYNDAWIKCLKKAKKKGNLLTKAKLHEKAKDIMDIVYDKKISLPN